LSNKPPSTVPKTDRRVRKTRTALIQAMVQLAERKRWASISVRELLEHADVGRSTFYAHFRSKDDLLFRSFEQMLLGLDAGIRDQRLAPVRELFAHAGESNKFHEALVRSKLTDRLYNRGIAVYARTIHDRLQRAPREDDPIPNRIRARALAGALFAMLEGWIADGRQQSPEQMDDLFHRL